MKKKTESKKLLDSDLVWAGIIFAATMLVYILLVQAWKITSPNYPPANALDHEVRLPEDRDDWLVRRGTGVCPFNANDFDIKDPLKGFRNC